MALFDFESLCVQENNFLDTDTTTWIGKLVQISVAISSNLIKETISLCNSNPGALVESFVGALHGLATHSKADMKLKFLELEASVKSKLYQFFSAFYQCRCRKEPVLEFEDSCVEDEEEEKEEQDVLAQFLQTQKSIY